MKLSRLVLWLLVAFLLGFATHAWVAGRRYQQRREAFQEYFRSIVHPGDDFGKVDTLLRKTGRKLEQTPRAHEFHAQLPADITDCFDLNIKFDDTDHVKEVNVYNIIVM